MTEIFDPAAQKNSPPQGGNLPPYSVSEISQALKRSVEDQFSHIRVRGELSGLKIAASGHMYADLKDDNSVINAVCWRGNVSRLPLKPEDGLDVVCTGRLSTYPGRSTYQIIIETMELAGEGALLKMLEQRKQALAAEGLFAPERKKPLPFIPKKIGVITSTTGVVIRDILHRLADRFPRDVWVWPVKVQGEGADQDIVKALEGMNALPETIKPDLLILARGGGSLEDLMAFNDEAVVRAVADCAIPIITAVGHETDTTLVDYASDRRAPTPTGAAEMAVPRRDELVAQVKNLDSRLYQSLSRQLQHYKDRLNKDSRFLDSPSRMLEAPRQQFDYLSQRLGTAFDRFVSQKETALVRMTARLRNPKEQIRQMQSQLGDRSQRLSAISLKLLKPFYERIANTQRLLDSLSYERVLDRGFALVSDGRGNLIDQPDKLSAGEQVILRFKGKIEKSAIITQGEGKPKPTKKTTHKKSSKDQGRLF